MTNAKFIERKRQQRRRTMRRIAVGVLALLVAGGLVWLIGFSQVLAVKKVEVRGLVVGEEGDVRELARIAIGEPLARVDTSGAAKRVEELEVVESAHVRRQWPNTIRIEVIERLPIAYMPVAGGAWLFDRHGVIYLFVEDDLPDDLMHVEYGGPAEDRELAISEVAEILNEIRLNAPSFFVEMTRIDVESRDSIEFRLDDGSLVRWGSAERSDDKLQVLQVLRQVDASIYDVRSPHQPTTTP